MPNKPKTAKVGWCPHCGHGEIKYYSNDIIDNLRVYQCGCEKCMEDFTEVYEEVFIGNSLDQSGSIDLPTAN